MAATLTIPLVDDFELGDAGAAWERLAWQGMGRVSGNAPYQSRFKMAWSGKGIYCLADCEDKQLSCRQRADFDDLFRDDVVEAFFWPSEALPLYFEYEISPLGKELPILVPNDRGAFQGWLPWHYQGERKTRTATQVRGGKSEPGASVSGWSAAFFIPFALLKGLTRAPRIGESWRANVYRIDYDQTPGSQWAWCEDTGPNFHDYRKFGRIEFGPKAG